MCWRKGVKSEPEPRSPTWTSGSVSGGALEARCSLASGGHSSTVVDGSAGWDWERAGELANELLERGNGGGGEIGAGDGYVGVEVGDGAFEGFGVLLDPLG
jgi:hypothetical protein